MTDARPQAKDPYKILGVGRDATRDEIHAAYVKLARKYHPDMHPPGATYAEEMFKEVASAYQVLSDDSLRARYDQGPVRNVRHEPVDIDPAILSVIQRPARDPYRRQFALPGDMQVTGIPLRAALFILGLGVAALVAASNHFAGYVLLVATISLSAGWLAASIAAQNRRNALAWFFIVVLLVIIASAPISIRLVHL